MSENTLQPDADSGVTQLLTQAGLGYCVLNHDLAFQSVDNIVTTITGYDAASLTTYAVADLVPREAQSGHAKSLQMLLDGELRNTEIPILTHDGNQRWILLTVLSVGEHDIHLLLQDITDAHLKEIERATAIFNALSDSVLIVNRDKDIVEIYPNATNELLPDEIVGKSIREGIGSDDLADEVSYYIDRTLDTGEIQAFEFHSFVTEDETRFYDIRIARINNHEVLALIREITDLKRVQEELSSHIEDLTILRQVDAELADKLKIERATQLGLDAMMRLSNARSGFVALLEAQYLKLIHVIGAYNIPTLTDYLERTDTLIAEVLKTRQPLWLINDDLKNHPAYQPLIEKTVGVIVIPLILQNRMIGIVNLETIVADDFTYDTFEFLQLMVGRIAVSLENARLVAQINWQLEEQQRLYEEVSRLEQIKTDMIRIASHDLRNPLAAILGYLEMLNWDMEKIEETHRGYISNIEEAARRMQKITSDILSLERIEESALHNTAEVFELNNLLQQTYNEHRPSAQLKKHTYNITLPDETIIVEADPMQLHEAVANLVGNALKYTPDHGEVKLTLDQVGTTARVRVVDNGFGIPEDKQERLFQPFYRAKTQETESIQGTGLGLHLVKNIIERFGGTLVFKSIYKQGSTFGFDMPISTKQANSPANRFDDVDGSVVVG